METAVIDSSVTRSPLVGYQQSNNASNSIVVELSRPAVRANQQTLQAAEHIVELVSKPNFPQDCFPVDGFTSTSSENR